MKFALFYFSKTGHTKEMAEKIAEGMRRKGCEARLFSVEEPVDAQYVESCRGLVFWTPTYAGNACWQMVKWLQTDFGTLKPAGKLGGAFATAHYAQGGLDSAIMTIINHILVFGMAVFSGGGSYGKPILHHGPVALDAVEGHYEACKTEFELFGERFASKAMELFKD